MLISPIINGLACFTFFLFYQVWKYLFTWQLDQPPASETGGLFFPKAMQHVFVGMYVQQICLAALFFLAQDENNRPSAIPMGALMVVLIFFTVREAIGPLPPFNTTNPCWSKVCFNLLIVNSYGPLKSALPLSLADKTYDANNQNQSEEDLSPESSGKPLPPDPRTSQDAANVEDGGVKSSPIEAKPKDEDAEEDEELHDFTIEGPNDFNHPASFETQRIIWIPDDELGLGKAELEDMRNRGVEASLEKAEMDEKGKIRITGPPPGGPEINVE